MNRRNDLMRPLLTVLNFLALALFGCLFYLLAGEAVGEMMHEPQAITPPAYRPGSGSGGGNGGDPDDNIVDGIHVASGLAFAPGFVLVRSNCTGCHSAKLITQNRATAAGWTEMIRWMQAKQGLHDLGEHEPVIVAYLAEHYAPKEVGRRAALGEVEWYILMGSKQVGSGK